MIRKLLSFTAVALCAAQIAHSAHRGRTGGIGRVSSLTALPPVSAVSGWTIASAERHSAPIISNTSEFAIATVSAKMENVDKLAKRIQRAIPKTSGGSLRFWGAWFGRPYDAFHTIVKCEAEKGVLRGHRRTASVEATVSCRLLTVGS